MRMYQGPLPVPGRLRPRRRVESYQSVGRGHHPPLAWLPPPAPPETVRLISSSCSPASSGSYSEEGRRSLCTSVENNNNTHNKNNNRTKSCFQEAILYKTNFEATVEPETERINLLEEMSLSDSEDDEGEEAAAPEEAVQTNSTSSSGTSNSDSSSDSSESEDSSSSDDSENDDDSENNCEEENEAQAETAAKSVPGSDMTETSEPATAGQSSAQGSWGLSNLFAQTSIPSHVSAIENRKRRVSASLQATQNVVASLSDSSDDDEDLNDRDHVTTSSVANVRPAPQITPIPRSTEHNKSPLSSDSEDDVPLPAPKEKRGVKRTNPSTAPFFPPNKKGKVASIQPLRVAAPRRRGRPRKNTISKMQRDLDAKAKSKEFISSDSDSDDEPVIKVGGTRASAPSINTTKSKNNCKVQQHKVKTVEQYEFVSDCCFDFGFLFDCESKSSKKDPSSDTSRCSDDLSTSIDHVSNAKKKLLGNVFRSQATKASKESVQKKRKRATPKSQSVKEEPKTKKMKASRSSTPVKEVRRSPRFANEVPVKPEYFLVEKPSKTRVCSASNSPERVNTDSKEKEQEVSCKMEIDTLVGSLSRQPSPLRDSSVNKLEETKSKVGSRVPVCGESSEAFQARSATSDGTSRADLTHRLDSRYRTTAIERPSAIGSSSKMSKCFVSKYSRKQLPHDFHKRYPVIAGFESMEFSQVFAQMFNIKNDFVSVVEHAKYLKRKADAVAKFKEEEKEKKTIAVFGSCAIYVESILYFIYSAECSGENKSLASSCMYQGTHDLSSWLTTRVDQLLQKKCDHYKFGAKLLALNCLCECMLCLRMYMCSAGDAREVGHTLRKHCKQLEEQARAKREILPRCSAELNENLDTISTLSVASSSSVVRRKHGSNNVQSPSTQSTPSPADSVNSDESSSSGYTTCPERINNNSQTVTQAEFDELRKKYDELVAQHTSLMEKTKIQTESFDYLVSAIDIWNYVRTFIASNDLDDFFCALDRCVGPIEFFSTVQDMFIYIKTGILQLLSESEIRDNGCLDVDVENIDNS